MSVNFSGKWAHRFTAPMLGGLIAALAADAAQPEARVYYRPAPQVRVVTGLEFARYGPRRLKLDLYAPRLTTGALPGVIVIRGGGWMVNDRREFAHVAAALAQRGLVAASIEYRTADEAAFPAAIQDVKAAVRWLRANAKTYNVAPNAIGVLGGSSGGHMALLAGLSQGDPALEGQGGYPAVSSQMQAIVGLSAVTDPRRLSAGGQRFVTQFLHASLAQNAQLWEQAAPVHYLKAGSPPVLLLHSDADENVPPEQAARFAELARQAGAPAEVIWLPQAHHAFWNYQPWHALAMEKAADFLRRMTALAAPHR